MAIRETRAAKRYATALFELAKARSVVERVDEEIRQVASILADPRLRRFLQQPQIPQQKKLQLLDAALGDAVHPLLLSAIRVLLRKSRLSEFDAFASHYDLLTDRLRGVEEVTFITAVELPPEDYEELRKKAVKYSDYPKLRLATEVRPEILGGIIVELGREKVIDLSLRTQLHKLKQSLIKHRRV